MKPKRILRKLRKYNQKMNEPKTSINIRHYPDKKCRTCDGVLFETRIQIKYDPLLTTNYFFIPVYTCANCGTLLDLTVTPKKHEEK